MPSISISPPCLQAKWEEIKDKGPIVRLDKFVARVSHHGPFGYGDTAEEAFQDLIRVLHEEINDHCQGYLFDQNGCMPQPVDYIPMKYVPEADNGTRNRT